MTDLERLARALCRFDGNPENTKFEGRPMWESYVPQVLAVLQVLREPSEGMALAFNKAVPASAVPSEDGGLIAPFPDWLPAKLAAMIDHIIAQGAER